MTIRLYDSAWVLLKDSDQPEQVRKNAKNPAMFEAGGFRYDIDGRPYLVAEATPDIIEVLSLAAARERGLRMQYVGTASANQF